MDANTTLLLSCFMADLLQGRKHVAVGANLPIAATAALLARDLSGGTLQVSILGSRKYSTFTKLGDLFDFACQGRLDGFFLSPGQVDGQANINLIGVGTYPRMDVRWPGSHGLPLLYMMIPNIILFRDTHLKRTFVPKVDFITAPGVSELGIYRPGGPMGLLTNLGYFSFDRASAKFTLERVHAGHSIEEIAQNTGFEFNTPDHVQTTSPPDEVMVAALRERVVGQVADIYPQFAQSVLDALSDLPPGSAAA
jgi:glutaconate CoA-transferase subunit B